MRCLSCNCVLTDFEATRKAVVTGDYIEQRDWAKLGQKLYVMSYNYMEHFAQMEAQREVSNGL